MESSMSVSRSQYFAAAVGLAMVPQLLVLKVFSGAPVLFSSLMLLWNVAPMVTSVIVFLAGARRVAWGWLIAVALWGLWSAVSTVVFQSSTAALGFIWAPVWGLVLIGPIGAVIAIAHARKADREKSAEEG